MSTHTEVIAPSSSRPGPPSAGRVRRRSSSHSTQKKPWQQHHARRPSFHSTHSRPDPEEVQRLSQQISRQTTRTSHRRSPEWYKIRWFKGMVDDVKRRAPYYWSDWKDAWDYRVVPATVYMYFAKYVPNIDTSLPAQKRKEIFQSSGRKLTRLFQYPPGIGVLA